MPCRSRYCDRFGALLFCLVVLEVRAGLAEVRPVLTNVFPAGGQAGQAVEVTISGGNLQDLQTLHSNIAGLRCDPMEANRFRLVIPEGTPPGLYDLWALGGNGITAPRTFAVGTLAEHLAAEPNESRETAMAVPLDSVINGQILAAGDTDHFRFEAREGQRVVIECWAERIDSRLRAILEVFDVSGRRLAVNRGYYGADPLLAFQAPADGAYVIKVQDLISSGSADHYYRLDIDTGPRVAFSLPNIVQRGRPAKVALFGWNLPGASRTATGPADFDQLDIDLTESQTGTTQALPVGLRPAQAVLAGRTVAVPLASSRPPLVLGVTDVPVCIDEGQNHSPSSAQEIAVPCEVSGQLALGDECDWYAVEARQGEVLYLQGMGDRIDAPLDLQLSVLDAANQQVLAKFGDEVRNLSPSLPTAHLDPAGRWVAPADGRYLLAVRNLTGGLQTDPRRVYRLSVRREEPAFEILASTHGKEPSGWNVPPGGRAMFDIVALRSRGSDGPLRITAPHLPPGVECPDVWLGPGVDRGILVVSADQHTDATFDMLQLQASTESGSSPRPVQGGTVVRPGSPTGWGRLMSQIPLAINGEAPLRISADAHEVLEHHLYGRVPVTHSPGGVVDVAITVERQDTAHAAAVKLIGVGLPDMIANQTAVIPAGQSKGYLSFYLPPTLPVGKYSFAVRAETTVPAPNQKTETLSVCSNAVTIDVRPAAFYVDVAPFAVTQARRGDVIQIDYTARRLNGFIGKMHTELAVPGCITDIPGLRGRGVTFVGQTDEGSIQIIVNDDAPLGQPQFLRLLTVGVLEDEPIYLGSRFLALEVVE